MIDLLVVDDDVQWTALLATMAEPLGLSFEVLHDGAQALKEIGRLNPRVVVLDIMMPGMDGLSLCRQLKSRFSDSPPKIIIASNKPFQREQEDARRAGAEMFVRKTGRVADLMAAVVRLSRSKDLARPAEDLAQPAEDLAAGRAGRVPVFRVRVWGSRGPGGQGPSLATSCVSVEVGPRLFLLDAGSGLAGFFDSKPTPEAGLWVLLSHYHEDHVDGLYHLKAVTDLPINVAGPQDVGQPLGDVLRRHIPDKLVARMNVLDLPESGFQLPLGLGVRCLLTRHPGPTLAFRLDYQGRSVVYCPDNEIEEEEARTDFSDKLREFVKGSDLLLHDARYLDEDQPGHRLEGHSCVGSAVALARDCGARRLLLFHMDASYAGQRLERALQQAREFLRFPFSPLQVELAAPGMCLDV